MVSLRLGLHPLPAPLLSGACLFEEVFEDLLTYDDALLGDGSEIRT